MERNIDANIFMKKAEVVNIETSASSTATTSDNEINPEIFIKNEHVNTETTNVDTNSSSDNDGLKYIPINFSKNRGNGEVDVISLSNVTHIFNKSLDNEYKLFENFNLNIPDIPNQGQLVSIMGASGCGKSRLVRAICGLDDIQAGDIKIYGKTLSEYNKNIPMVFQTYSNYEWMTVLDNIMLPMIIRGIDKEKAKEKALELINIVGLKEHANKYPSKLSGGQQQRVSIARSLACDSQIIVFDEATGALDIKMKREVQNIILKIFYETAEDPTILNITHSIEEAAYISNKVYILKPNPCQIYKEIDIHYTGEETRNRGEWVLETPEYANYVKEITKAMDEVCK